MKKLLLIVICAISLMVYSCKPKEETIDTRLDRLEMLIKSYSDKMATASEESIKEAEVMSEDINQLLAELTEVSNQMTPEQSARYGQTLMGSLGVLSNSLKTFRENLKEIKVE